MTISSIYTSSSSATIGLISGTGTVQSSSVSDVVSQNQEGDQANISQGAQTMSKLASLASSDPTKFKAAAQKIADGLKEKADGTSDADEKQRLTDMASQFSEAAETGSMDSLKPPTKPTDGAMTASGKNIAKFTGGKNKDDFMSSVGSIISNALSSVGASSSSTSSSSSSSESDVTVTTVDSSHETAA